MTGDTFDLVQLGLFDFLYEELDDRSEEGAAYTDFLRKLMERIIDILKDDDW